MKKIVAVILFVLLVSVFAQAGEKNYKTILVYRNSFDTGRDTGTHMAEFVQTRNAWIVPDIFYCDSNSPSEYREMFVGGGRTLISAKHFTISGEMYVGSSSGSKAKGEFYFMPFVSATFRGGKFAGEIATFPYIPLNSAGKYQFVLERAKIDYGLSKFLKMGVGYGAYWSENGKWLNKPFFYPGIKMGKLGELELWLQEIPSTARIFVRYKKVF
jgi:hypothetical protein